MKVIHISKDVIKDYALNYVLMIEYDNKRLFVKGKYENDKLVFIDIQTNKHITLDRINDYITAVFVITEGVIPKTKNHNNIIEELYAECNIHSWDNLMSLEQRKGLIEKLNKVT